MYLHVCLLSVHLLADLFYACFSVVISGFCGQFVFYTHCMLILQVWEITGAEFTKSDIHTADGISIRFPRVTRIRDDKDWKTATDLPRLKVCVTELPVMCSIVYF